jgi:hypothetical protein
VYSQLLLTTLGSHVEETITELVVATRGSLYNLVLALLDGRCLLGLRDLVGSSLAGRHFENGQAVAEAVAVVGGESLR